MNFPIATPHLLATLLFPLCLTQSSLADEAPVVHLLSPERFSAGVVEGVEAGPQPPSDAADEPYFSVRADALPGHLAVNLDWMKVQPRTRYRARVRVRGGDELQAASLHLMIREHPAEQSPPLQPYHVTSSNQRELDPAGAGQWVERTLDFVTLDGTHALSGAIVIGNLAGELQLSAFELLDFEKQAQGEAEAAEAEYKQVMAEIRAQAAARERLVPRTLVYSRAQLKYGLEKNYYHEWVDRPLLVNRAYRVPSKWVTPFPSYQRILQAVANYEIDGLAFFPETSSRMGMHEYHDEAGVEGVQLLPEFLPQFGGNDLERKLEVVERALKSRSAPRINGKLLITSYHAGNLSPEEWEKRLRALRERFGDVFVFLPALTNVASLRKPFMEGKPIARETIEKEKDYLRSYLDVTDGIYFNSAAAFRNKDRTFDEAFYREIFIPVFKSVLSEPKYRHKYLGLSAYRSHMNPDRSNSLHEDLTRTLRRSFEAAMEADPDVLILPEWDEFNENTCWRPTVFGGTTSMRIVRYYMSGIKGKEPTPVPGDDETVPNLILSARKVLTVGERLIVELLNVPDGTESHRYTAQLTLQDEHGNVVHEFEAVEFDAARLQEERLEIPSESAAHARALIPALKVRGYKGRDCDLDTGFHHIQLRATWNWDYLAVRQPLRDLLRPEVAAISWKETTPAEDGSLVISGTISSPEDLALVEVLADDDEVYAVDPKNEFFRNDPERQLILIEYRSINPQELVGTLTLRNTSAEWHARGTVLPSPMENIESRETVFNVKSSISLLQRCFYLAIPVASVPEAELELKFEQGQFTVPVREVLEKQMVARAFANGMHVAIHPYRKMLDMPHHLDQKEISFSVRIWPEIGTEVYHLRLTSKNGRLHRTRPLILPTVNDGKTQTLRVFSETEERGMNVTVAADRIPDLVYDFDPERGAVLLTEAGRPFWAVLGGFANTATGRGATTGMFTPEPAYLGGKKGFAVGAENYAPEWVEDEGRPALRFDGVATHLKLPREALPRRGAFTIEFEVKPGVETDQTLLANRVGSSQEGLVLETRNGKLVASFRNQDWEVNRHETGFALPAKQWSHIRVRHDFEHLTVSVDGVEERFPATLPASNIGFLLIGDGWRNNRFQGLLRGLHIVHNAEEE